MVPVPLLPGRTPVMLRLKLWSLEPEAIVRTQSGSGPGQGIKAMGLIEPWVVVVTSCSLLRLLVPRPLLPSSRLEVGRHRPVSQDVSSTREAHS